MKIYLIDFENVKSKGLTGIDSLSEYDRVIIFYSENADTINFEMHQKVLISKAEVEYFKVHVGGKNALDFQLSTLLGYLVCKNYYSHIFVISNDKSFDFLHDFWHGKYIAAPDCVVYRTKTIAQAINYAGGKKQPVVEEDDASVFAPQETAVSEEPAADEVPLVVPAAAEEPAAEESAKAEEAAENEEKPVEKRRTRTSPRKTRNERSSRKQEPEQEEEFSISAEELNALEASFSAYSIIKPEDSVAAAPAEEVNEAPEEPAVEEAAAPEVSAEPKVNAEAEEEAVKAAPAEEQRTEQSDEKPAAKPAKEFFPSLKDALKKAKCNAHEINHISQLLINSDTKEEFHNALAKDYKQDATELYKLLRPKYLRLKEMYAAEHPEYVSPDTVTVRTDEPERAEDEQSAKPADAAERSAEEAKAENQTAERTDAEAVKEEKAEEKPAKVKRSGRGRKSAEGKKADKPAEDKPKAGKQRTKKQADVPSDAGGDRLAQLLDGKCSADELELIRQLFREVPSRQQLYIRMIKQFGKKSGCVYYNAIKPEYEALSEAIKA